MLGGFSVIIYFDFLLGKALNVFFFSHSTSVQQTCAVSWGFSRRRERDAQYSTECEVVGYLLRTYWKGHLLCRCLRTEPADGQM